MKHATLDMITVVHNKVPSRLRIGVPLIKNKRTFAELLKQNLLKDTQVTGIYHAEPNIVTGTILIKFHPALHTESEVLQQVETITQKIADGRIEISEKHKNPRLGKMLPQAFFTRELVVSICSNVVAGLILAAIVAG